jgi:hypothetical protein
MQLLPQGNKRKATNGNIHIEGQFYMDVGEGIYSGWDVKTWTNPNEPVFLQAEFHWIFSKSRNIHQTSHNFHTGGVPIIAADVTASMDARRKAFILETVTFWEKTRFD